MAKISPVSAGSLLIESLSDSGESIGSATGFVTLSGDDLMLMTNWHVVSGINPLTGEFLAQEVPYRLRIHHRRVGDLRATVACDEDLFVEPGVPRWLEHPELGKRVDAVALPLAEVPGDVTVVPIAVGGWPPSVVLPVASSVYAVGYPLGLSSSGLAIWIRGSIASEPDLRHDGLPMFLVDARTRKSQSGSPVVYYNAGGRVAFRNGGLFDNGMDHLELLGIYSGRLSEASDLGRVFRVDALAEIVNHGIPGSVP